MYYGAPIVHCSVVHLVCCVLFPSWLLMRWTLNMIDFDLILPLTPPLNAQQWKLSLWESSALLVYAWTEQYYSIHMSMQLEFWYGMIVWTVKTNEIDIDILIWNSNHIFISSYLTSNICACLGCWQNYLKPPKLQSISTNVRIMDCSQLCRTKFAVLQKQSHLGPKLRR